VFSDADSTDLHMFCLSTLTRDGTFPNLRTWTLCSIWDSHSSVEE